MRKVEESAGPDRRPQGMAGQNRRIHLPRPQFQPQAEFGRKRGNLVLGATQGQPQIAELPHPLPASRLPGLQVQPVPLRWPETDVRADRERVRSLLRPSRGSRLVDEERGPAAESPGPPRRDDLLSLPGHDRPEKSRLLRDQEPERKADPHDPPRRGTAHRRPRTEAASERQLPDRSLSAAERARCLRLRRLIPRSRPEPPATAAQAEREARLEMELDRPHQAGRERSLVEQLHHQRGAV